MTTLKIIAYLEKWGTFVTEILQNLLQWLGADIFWAWQSAGPHAVCSELPPTGVDINLQHFYLMMSR